MDAFTFTTKTRAITAKAQSFNRRGAAAVAARMATLEQAVADGTPLDRIRDLVIDMRGWAIYADANVAYWLDSRLNDLAYYLASDDQKAEIDDIAARLEASLLAGTAWQK